MTLGLLVAGGALLTGWLPLATAAAQPTPAARAPLPSATAVAAPAAPAAASPPATPSAPALAAAPTPGTQVKRGEVVSSGDWKAAVNDTRVDGQRVLVDWTVKN